MTFFYRGPSGRIPARSADLMRLATSVALIAYPLGCLIQLIFPDTSPEAGLSWGEGGGFALIILALFAFVIIAPSQLQRITGEEAKALDEFEINLRRRAYTFAYQVFAAIVLVGILYTAIAVDTLDSDRFTLWVPTSYDHWNAVFWGAVLYAFVLPTAYLAWTAPAPIEDEVEA
ncbi:MAG: hypothetical protein AAFX09_06410 [Pseudomonadota bacterium]